MNIKRYIYIAAICWSLLMLSAMGYEMLHTIQDSAKLALFEARTALAKDLIYRKWVVSKGGVYAPIAKNTLPNPYLHVPEQNIATPSGKELTLVNPAYMIRQVYELERQTKGIRSHITSLNPIRPENKADTWEEKVLQSFEKGVEEYSEQLEIEGQPYFRYMKVLTVQQGCLKCHAVQGYKEGEVRGGISIATPMRPIKTIERNNIVRGYFVHLLLWLIGLGGLSYGGYRLQKALNIQKEMEAEKEVIQSKMLHSQKLESVGHLAAGIAHEINTPAQFLGTNMEFLDDSFREIEELIKEYQRIIQAVKDGSASQEVLDNFEKSVEELDWEYLAEEIPLTVKQSREGIESISKIVLAMKEFSHPGSKNKAPVNINDIINTTVTVASNEWKYVAELESDLAPDLPSVTCQADEIGQVFLNILVNAAQAIGDKAAAADTSDGPKGLIHISSRLDGKWIEVQIRDNGQGMSDTVKAHIFDPFFTTREVGKGTGQGLTIAHSVVTNKHQGSISCESEEGVGTRFIIRLPITAEEAAS